MTRPPSPLRPRTVNTQQAIILAIHLHWLEFGYAPTLRYLRDKCEISSTSVVTYHLGLLREAGKVTFTDGAARTIRLVKAS